MGWHFSSFTCLFLVLNLISLCKGQVKNPGDLEKNVKLLPPAQYEQYCDLNTKCDSSKFLTCGGNHKCKCYDDVTYDIGKRICPSEDLHKNVRALPAPGQQYDQFCDVNAKCDRSKFLTCGGNSRCRCYDDLTYDAAKKICALRNDDPCLPPPNAVFKCLSNAACGVNGTCQCNPNYYNNNFGVCTPQASFNESCSDFNPVIPCSTYQGLQCTLNKCQCNSLNSTYSLENSQCVGKVGNPCINSKCIPGAICSSSNMCMCNSDETYPVGGDCLLKKPEKSPCTDEIECQKNLNCTFGFCECSSRDTALDTSSVWNITIGRFNTETFTKCVGLANRGCVDGLCVSNAFCVYTFPQRFPAGNLQGICNCYRGNRTENNFCRADFGQTCTSGKGCSNGLVCRDNLCSCEYPFNQMYDSSTKTCKSKVRGPCRKSQECNDNGVCSFITGISISPPTGHCTCPSGFIENAEGSCDIEFGNACTVMNNNVNSANATKCDRVAKLSCVNNLCACSDKFYEYDRDQRKCKGLVGALCNADKSISDCVTDALCLHPFSKTSVPAESDRLWSDDKINIPTLISRIGRCKCRDTTVETEDYKCK